MKIKWSKQKGLLAIAMILTVVIAAFISGCTKHVNDVPGEERYRFSKLSLMSLCMVKGQVHVQFEPGDQAGKQTLSAAWNPNDIVVYLSKGVTQSPPGMNRPPRMFIGNGQYTPLTIAVRVGETVGFDASDKEGHNVRVESRNEDREGSLGMQNPRKFARLFKVPEVFIRLKCDVHPEERGYVAVFDHSDFCQCDGRGRFSLPHALPPGSYTLTAAHPTLGSATTTFVLDKTMPLTSELELTIQARSPGKRDGSDLN